jgi:cyclopropane-fatty-acyl-phospholipid synthase
MKTTSDTTSDTTRGTDTTTGNGHGTEPRADGVAVGLRDVLDALLGTPVPVRLEFWDGSGVGPVDGPGTLHVRSPEALRRILWAPGELGLARAFVTGDLGAEGDVIELLTAMRHRSPREQPLLRSAPAAMAAARRYGVLGRPLPPPDIEYQPPVGRAHTKARDAETVGHHYDVSNEFYAMVLGPSMTYSCALFAEPRADLATAQAAKHDRVCRKLGLDLAPGSRLLDVGCGWGSMAIHAAQHHDARVVGITISAEQAALARRRVEAAGVSDRVEIRLQDYRDLRGENFDAISSIGMSEHVGRSRLDTYFTTLRALLRPQGRLLNHAISSVGGSKLPRRSFVYRYVFPDGELIDVGETVLAMERAGFEVRDVESLREHYATTLRHWVANLEQHWDDAVADVGEQRARAWLLYMAASSVGFTDGGINIHQVLGVVPDADGTSGMPTVRPF